MNKISKILVKFKNPIFYIPSVLIIIGVIYFFIQQNNSNGNSYILTIAPSDFVQNVAVTGKVVAAQNVDSGFESNGSRVSKINVNVGDQVKLGQVLASLSNNDLQANLLQRQALLESEQAKLAQLVKGSRAEDLGIAQANADSAKNGFEENKKSLVDEMKDAFAKSDDAVRNKADPLYSNPRGAYPQILSFDNYNLTTTLNNQRIKAGEMLSLWLISTSNLTTDNLNDSDLKDTNDNLSFMRDYFNNLSIAVSSIQANSTITQSILDKYKSDISTARSNIDLAISGMNSAQQAYNTAKYALDSSTQQLALKKNGATPEELLAEEAQVKSAEAQVESARAALNKTLIIAPIDGIITKVDAKVGEIPAQNSTSISMMGLAKYELESYISENDIAKIKTGQVAKITLDAFGKDTFFDAKVTEVNLSETVLDGVSTYKTRLQFINPDERIKSGMTANIGIETDHRSGVISVPQMAVFLKGSDKYVSVKQGGGKSDRKITTGSISSDGSIEIISGLNTGDQVIVPGAK